MHQVIDAARDEGAISAHSIMTRAAKILMPLAQLVNDVCFDENPKEDDSISCPQLFDQKVNP